MTALTDLIIKQVSKDPSIREYIEQVGSGRGTGLLVPSNVRSAVTAALFRSTKKPLLLITPHQETALKYQEELGALLGVDCVKLLLPNETLAFEKLTPNPEVTGKRLEALNNLANGKRVVVICPAASAVQLLPEDGALPLEPVKIKKKAEIDRDRLISMLTAFGYERDYLVAKRGQFSVRGDIVDVFPGTTDHPMRIEFFGDEIESLRMFDLGSQTSIESMEKAEIYAVRGLLQPKLSARKKNSLIQKYPGLTSEIDMLAEGRFFPGFESYWPLFAKGAGLLELISSKTTVLIDEPPMLALQAERFLRGWTERLEHKAATEGLPSFEFVAPWKKISSAWKGALSGFSSSIKSGFDDHIKAEPASFESLFGRISDMAGTVQRLASSKSRVVIAVETEGRGNRIREILAEADISAVATIEQFRLGSVIVARLPWMQGFWLPESGLALISENDIFRKAYRYRQDKQIPQGESLRTVFDVSPGDYVVHVDAGIGRFRGLITKTIMSVTREYMEIEYAEGDRLYVPLDQLDRVQKFIGVSGLPIITRLGGKDWQRAKARARDSVKKLAFDLVELYADRLKAQKVPYGPDTAWQRELEDSFPFIETPDQANAIRDTKSDLQSTAPMDRLVCGDVGYGKTEVALRAAFKVVADGHQVAILAPTTILAEQHYRTFSDRLAPFPVKTALLSRFVSRAEQTQVIKELALGQVDIVIGTHRLLQPDIVFHNLGLVVIDEEQRFGVGHKEKIKNLRRNVDVLTLSATPIPRTLQMALSGVRDLSIINTPPNDRLPVTTYVGPHDKNLIIDAIRRELAREGQVFYVHNQVATINETGRQLNELVPEAKLVVAHGQMPEHTLEKTMQKFIDHETDILVCTTIIESGIDIPGANTLIVENAERFGLAQLYQLRGRVGRAHQQAYAYFFVNGGKAVSENAERRLQTIGEFTDLGSGFKIAMQDLEIRGAGNILGAEQSGNIASVGFELYSQLLRDEVGSLQGNAVAVGKEIRIDIPVDAYLPSDYIDNETARVESYQAIVSATTIDDVARINGNLRDRFGPLPKPAKALLEIAEIRVLAARAGIDQIVQEGRGIRLRPIKIDSEIRPVLEKKFHGQKFTFTANTLLFSAEREVKLILVKDLLGAIISLAF